MENLNNAFTIRKTNIPAKAFLLDDLVTSGATAMAAAKALKVRNIQYHLKSSTILKMMPEMEYVTQKRLSKLLK